MATPDLMLELVGRIVEDQKEHSRMIGLRVLRVMSMQASQRQRQLFASDLRDLADDLEATPVLARRQMGKEI
jgi:hypothetical protein